jgi:RHS repeat-associated protein
MELTPGAHHLAASALHPSGLFTTNVSVWFTNNSAREASHIYRDGAGNITARIWTSPSGTTNRVQSLFWDGRARLCIVMDYDAQGNGFYEHPIYDGLDRLLYTVWYPVTGGGVSFLVASQTNAFVYDPQVQFLDMGVYVGPSGQDSMPGQMAWKLCGPDLNGRYGGLNGAGGLEATATGAGYFAPTLSDARGNVLAVCDPAHGTVTWSASRPTGYGAVPGYRPLPLGHGGSYAQSAAWCGKWADATGYIWRGHRFYDPIAGMWLSPDPQWNDQDPSYWSFCGGDPINRTDANGECLETAWNFSAGTTKGFAQGYTGIYVSPPANTTEYYGQQFGRSGAGALALWLTAEGGANTGTGLGIMAASGSAETVTLGGATVAAGPAFAFGAVTAIEGAAQTGVGAFGLYNYNKLQPLEQPSQPQGGLHPDAGPYSDPAPPEYEGGYEPSQVVKDHLDARAHGGPDVAGNIDPKSWESNAIKGGREGQLLQYEQYLRENGMQESDIRKVTAGEWQSIRNDVHARAVDPRLLEKLPAPEPTAPSR